MILSKRLETILSMIPDSRCVADIGTDHAYIPIECIRRGRSEKAIASDVKEGPIKIAKTHIAAEGLSERIETRLGDGLRTLTPGEADTVVIAGLGGLLMIKILSESPDQACAAETLLLSPHSEIRLVRMYLTSHGFSIEDEEMTEEDGKYYTVMKVVPVEKSAACFAQKTEEDSHGEGGSTEPGFSNGEGRTESGFFNGEGRTESEFSNGEGGLTETELSFGPCLLRKKTPVFRAYIAHEIEKVNTVIQKLEASEEKESLKNVIEEKKNYRKQLEEIC